MINMIASLAQHYPCKLCRRHLREKLQVRMKEHKFVHLQTTKPVLVPEIIGDAKFWQFYAHAKELFGEENIATV